MQRKINNSSRKQYIIICHLQSQLSLMHLWSLWASLCQHHSTQCKSNMYPITCLQYYHQIQTWTQIWKKIEIYWEQASDMMSRKIMFMYLRKVQISEQMKIETTTMDMRARVKMFRIFPMWKELLFDFIYSIFILNIIKDNSEDLNKLHILWLKFYKLSH